MELMVRTLVTDAIVYSMSNDKHDVIKIVGNAVVGFDMDDGVIDSDIVWNTAYDMFGGDSPDAFDDFMEELYGDTGHIGAFPDELGNELRSIIDSFDWKD